MILNDNEDTIVALATPPGESALAIIRLSGPQTFQIVDRCFRAKKPVAMQPSHTIQFGKIVEASEKLVDEVLCAVFRAPHSYTGEDSVEISCHGGVLVTRRILEILVESGARLAKPGEFTKRAFLNGKIDLSQAEAVADLIHAQSVRAHQSSINQLIGRLSKEIKKLRDELVESLRLLELELDFVEEDIEFVDKANIETQINKTCVQLQSLINTYKVGKVYKEGVKVVLVGEPNVGKSSLLNALLEEERAIVTHIPGTTRDFIEEAISIEGILFRLVDTAGIRETEDPIEKEGVRRTEELASTADVILAIFDASKPINMNSIISHIKKAEGSHLLVVLNKTDLKNPDDFIETEYKTIKTSAKIRDGIEELKRELLKIVSEGEGTFTESSVVVTNQRHVEALQKALISLNRAKESLKNNVSNEFIAIDLRLALDFLGEIIGVVTTDDILNGIFEKFCIGK